MGSASLTDGHQSPGHQGQPPSSGQLPAVGTNHLLLMAADINVPGYGVVVVGVVVGGVVGV